MSESLLCHADLFGCQSDSRAAPDDQGDQAGASKIASSKTGSMSQGSAHSSLLYFLGRCANLLLAPVAVLLLPGILGQDGYGQYSYWLGLLSVYIIACDAGAQPMLRRFLPQMIASLSGQSRALFRMALNVKLMLLPLLVCTVFLADNPRIILSLLVAALLASLATNLADVFYSYQSMGRHSMAVLCRKLFRFTLVPLLFLQFDVAGILIALVAAEVLGFLVATPAYRLFDSKKAGLEQPFLRYYRQGLAMFFAMFAAVLIGRTPVFFAEWTGMEAELIGRVALCVDLSYFALKELINAVSESILPRLISLHASGRPDKMSMLIGQNYRIVNMLTLCCVSLGIGLAEAVLRLLGEDFYLATQELQLLLSLVIFSSWNLIHTQLLLIEEKGNTVFLCQCAGLMPALMCILFFLDRLSIQILVISLGLAMVSSCLLSYLAVRKKYSVKTEARYFYRPLMIAIVMAYALAQVDISGIWGLIASGLIGSVCFFAMLLLSKGIHEQDLRLLRSFIGGQRQ